mmetsp:Transcript_13664/g.36603  ORF Transcript_13664/g.36603 Transcript_13664/m.36603 type:complete len:336 (-) Transcript_13664:1249-2256(-)
MGGASSKLRTICAWSLVRGRWCNEPRSAAATCVQSARGGMSSFSRVSRGAELTSATSGFSSTISASKHIESAGTASSAPSECSLGAKRCTKCDSTPAARSSSRPALTAGFAVRGTTISSTRRTTSARGGGAAAPADAACTALAATVSGSTRGCTQKVAMLGPRLASLATTRTAASRTSRDSHTAANASNRRSAPSHATICRSSAARRAGCAGGSSPTPPAAPSAAAAGAAAAAAAPPPAPLSVGALDAAGLLAFFVAADEPAVPAAAADGSCGWLDCRGHSGGRTSPRRQVAVYTSAGLRGDWRAGSSPVAPAAASVLLRSSCSPCGFVCTPRAA